MAIRLTTLGGLRAYGDIAELDWLLSQRLRAALFVYVAVERRVSREALIAAFWPESDETNARHALRQTLYHLRKALGDSWFDSRAHELRVSADVHSDAQAFDAALERHDAEGAVRLYAGPFLEGVNLVDLKGWEAWVDGRRTRYARAFRKACRAWLDARRAAGDVAGAVEAAQRWLGPDPFDDEAQHKLIEALADAGERAEAIRQYESYARLLEPDGLRPLDETIKIVTRVRAQAASWPAASNEARDSGAPESGRGADAGAAAQDAAAAAARDTHGATSHAAQGKADSPSTGDEAGPVSPPLDRGTREREAQNVGVRSKRGRRALVRILAVAIVAVVLGAVWLAPRLGGAPLDPERVIVFPLNATDPELNRSGAGWDVAVAIGAALEHTEPLRWIDGWTWLPEAQRADLTRITPRLAREISRERGARYYVDGVIGGSRARPTVTLRLHDIAGDSLVTQETASSADNGVTLAGLGLQSAVGVLKSLLAPGRAVDLAPIADRSPAAIALWIRGEHEYRNARFEAALDYFGRALEQDSLLVFAGMKGVLAAYWLERGPDHAGMLSLALRNDTLLPTKYRLFARGLRAFDESRADDALAIFNEVLTLDPDWSEAWMALGEVHYHLLPGTLLEPAGPGDSIAVDAFRRAAAIDTSFSPPLLHLGEHAARAGDARELALIVKRLEGRGAPADVTEPLALLLECLRRGADAFVQTSSDLLRLGTAAKTMAAATRIDCAEVGFRRILVVDDAPRPYRLAAILALNGILMARGRYTEVKHLLQGERERDLPVDYLQLFDALAGGPFRAEAEAAVRNYEATYGDTYSGAPPNLLWLLGVWHARAGDIERARSLAEALDRDASAGGDASAAILAAAVRAHAVLAEGDTANALLRFGDLASAWPAERVSWSAGPPLALERLTLAELLLACRQYAQAQRVASALDHPIPIMFLPLLRPSLAVRALAAEALGQPRDASAYRARLAALGSSITKPAMMSQPQQGGSPCRQSN